MIKRMITKLRKQWRTVFVLHPELIPHLNGNSLLSPITLKIIWWYIFGMLWFLTAFKIGTMYISDDLNAIINQYLGNVNKYLAKRLILNCMITYSIIIIFYKWSVYVWKDRYLSLNRLFGSICVLILLSYGSSYTKVYSYIKIDFASIFNIFFRAQIIIEVIKLWFKRWSINNKIKGHIKYNPDVPQEHLDEKVRLEYAKRVSELLFNTDISESSFAIGITSEWGSGKTSFLLDMKKEMEKKCYLMDFKPWDCQTTDQIVNEFFELFRKQIKRIYSPLHKPILRYAQLLNDSGLPKYLNPLLQFLTRMELSIDGYKMRIENGLKQLDKPVVVVIDDMDRLAANEMFEVLRLIRNTAAFPNLLFVVFYDKAYVINQIKNKGIDESDLYLEKIFPIELSLPKIEEFSLFETFRKSLIEMHFLHGKHDRLTMKITPEDERMLVRLLPTYRKIKRFARVLMTNATFIMDKMGGKNVDLYDIFLIELLHFCIPDIYVLLRDTPEELLAVRTDNRTRQAIYYLLPDDVLDKKLEQIMGLSLDRYERQLLHKCFSPRNGDRYHYLPYVDSYDNYFCLATPDKQISKEEFLKVVSDRSTIRKRVHDWFFKMPVKKSDSLYSKLIGTRIKELSLKEWEDYLYLVYSWMCEDEYNMIKDVLLQYLLEDIIRPHNEESLITAQKYAQTKLEQIIKTAKVNRLNVAKNLCGYYSIIEKQETEYLLGSEFIKKILSLNFRLFMKEKNVQHDAINVVALNGNELNAFVKAHAVVREEIDFVGDYKGSLFENLIIDDVIGFFGDYKQKSNHFQEAKEIYQVGANKYKEMSDLSQSMLIQERNLIFGDITHYERYLRECFVKL